MVWSTEPQCKERHKGKKGPAQGGRVSFFGHRNESSTRQTFLSFFLVYVCLFREFAAWITFFACLFSLEEKGQIHGVHRQDKNKPHHRGKKERTERDIESIETD